MNDDLLDQLLKEKLINKNERQELKFFYDSLLKVINVDEFKD